VGKRNLPALSRLFFLQVLVLVIAFEICHGGEKSRLPWIPERRSFGT